MLSNSTKNRLKYALANPQAANEIEQVLALGGGGYGDAWFVDPFVGIDSNAGTSWAEPFDTMSAALTAAQTGDTVFFRGDIREELVGSNLKFDITIVGVGSQHHPDQPNSTYDPGAAMWRPPASPTATTPLLEVRGRGWKFVNIAFDCPVDAPAVKLVSNALSDVSEYDASHASFLNCSFQQGKYGIQDDGGVINITIDDCVFRIISVASGVAIYNSSTSVRVPQYWRIRDCNFPGNGQSGGNETHIDAPLSGSLITRCFFGTVEGTGLYIDLTGGDDNTVCFNVLGGVYDTTDYVAGTADLWYQNAVAVVAVTAPDGVSLAAPAAP